MEINNGINKNTYDLLINSYNRHLDDVAPYADAIADIGIFTTKSNTFKDILIKDMIQIKHLKYDYNMGMYKYKLGIGDDVYFHLASDVLTCLSDKEKIELLSDRRKNHCYQRSILLSPRLTNSMIIFGTIQVGDYQFLHSAVQFVLDSRLFVVDWNFNIIMTKEDYVKLFHLKTINMVSSVDINYNYNICSDLFYEVPLPIFLGFNQELVDRARTLKNKKKTG